MTYPQALHYLYSFLNFEHFSKQPHQQEFKLERMKKLLELFHHPENKFKSILVAGTKGKGSTSYFLHSILKTHGLKVGLYTSPHLSDFRERIRVDDQLIPKQDLVRIMKKVRKVIELKRKHIRRLEPVTFFEVSTLLAILYFAEQRVDWAILEVGMGGRLDATNSVHQLLSVFTLIGKDHQEYLGRTVRQIAYEKAAIIKSKAPFLSAKQVPDAARAIRLRARQFGAAGYFCGADFHYRIHRISSKGSCFDFCFQKGTGSAVLPVPFWGTQIKNIILTLPGTFQVENASLAIAAFLVLREQNFPHPTLSPFGGEEIGEGEARRIKKGVQICKWPGRFEVIRKGGRTYILDGAHNIDSILALARNIKKIFPRRKVLAIFGLSRGKELRPLLRVLSWFSNVLVATQSSHPRAQIAKRIVEIGKETSCRLTMVPTFDVREAMGYARRIVGNKELILVTGSLFLVGEARRTLRL